MAATNLSINAGTNTKVVFDPESGTGSGDKFTFPNTDWSINESANVPQTVNARDGVQRKKSFIDVGSITVNINTDDVDMTPGTDFAVGDSGNLKLFYSTTKFRQLNAILMDVTHNTNQPGSFQGASLTFALCNGTITNGSE